jgi:amino acid adenylation domain-containing protein
MSDISEQIAALSPEKRALLALKLKEKGQHFNSFPLSYAQERMWFLSQLNPNSAFYNIPTALKLTGNLDIAALEQTLNKIVERHEVLRASILTVNGRAMQVVSESAGFTLSIVDLSQLPEQQAKRESQRLRISEASRGFDLQRGPLFRAVLTKLTESEHVIMFTMHHIVSDGWSMGILVREVAQLYDAYTKGKPSPLKKLSIQYTDYAVWQRDQLRGEHLQKLLAYWRGQLEGKSLAFELPNDYRRPPIQSFDGAKYYFMLEGELVAGLRALSRRAGATLFMVLMAGYHALLHRYSGQESICVGAPVAGRARMATESLIGLFVNTVVIPAALRGDPCFEDLVSQVKRTVIGAYEHQELPFEKMVEEIQPERDLSRSPLFQVMFALQNASVEKLDLEGLTIKRLDMQPRTSKFDMTLNIAEAEKSLAGSIEYCTRLFDEKTIIRMADHFRQLLTSAVENPKAPLSELPLLTVGKERQLLAEWNDSTVEYKEPHCIHRLFESQVERAPDAVAVAFEGKLLTYAEINRKANQLAHYLRSRGIGPEKLVGVFMERSLEMVIALLGILKAGGAYAPLDPSYPEERLKQMADGREIVALLTQSHLRRRAPQAAAESICVDADWQIISEHVDTNPVGGAEPDNLAYVIYTSGSTGRPKGVMIAHRAICNRLLWMQDFYGIVQEDRVLQKTPFSFDVSVWEFFWPLLNGARLVVARPEGHKDSQYLVSLIVEQRISVLHFVPSMLKAFLQEEDLEKCKSLRHVICSGEALTFDLQTRFFKVFEAELSNLYGPTEAAVDVTYWLCLRDGERKVVPIGRPIANTQIYVLDKHMRPAPVGIPGELYIGGAGVGRGYLGAADLTATKFIPDPFKGAGGRLYRTGDLARYLDDGTTEYLGRIDDQVKLHGFRIELSEIETALNNHPAVDDSVVVVREDISNDKRLVAYIIPRREQSPTAGELRAYLKLKLPDYMIASTFVIRESLPLTSSGKLDRKRLPAPDAVRLDLEASYVPPQGELEELIAGVWQDVLGIPKVGVKDNFFDLGGHSFLTLQVHLRLRAESKTNPTVADLFKYPTVRSLAQFLGEEAIEESSAESREDRARSKRESMMRRKELRRQRRTADPRLEERHE